MSNNVGDTIIVAPYCKSKFEVGQIVETTSGGNWLVKMWGICQHPIQYGSEYTYGKLIRVTKNNAWSPDRLGEAISYWMDKHKEGVWDDWTTRKQKQGDQR
jgi:hypothetical protein